MSAEANATCNECGYRGIRTEQGKWCPACWEDEGGELIVDAGADRIREGQDER